MYVCMHASGAEASTAAATAARPHSQNGSKTTRIYTDSRIIGGKRLGFIDIIAECVENDKDL